MVYFILESIQWCSKLCNLAPIVAVMPWNKV